VMRNQYETNTKLMKQGAQHHTATRRSREPTVGGSMPKRTRYVDSTPRL